MTYTKGFTLAEVLIAMTIALGLFAAVADFSGETFGLGRKALTSMDAEWSARRAMKMVAADIRLVSSFVETATTTLAFLADLDDDGEAESVRYRLNPGGVLVREVGGAQSVLANGLENSSSVPLFEYQGDLVEISIILGGKTYTSSATPRNLNDDE